MVVPRVLVHYLETITYQQQKGNYMKKSILTLAAIAMSAAATPALAGSLTAEARFADVRGGTAPNSTELRAEYWAPVNSLMNYGAELPVKQKTNDGPLTALVSAKAAVNGPTVAGVHTAAFVELGESLSQKVSTTVAGRTTVTGGNHEFWGAGVKLKRDLFGPVALTAGYRHREGFDAADKMNEERLMGGLSVAVNDKTALGATYYRTTGTTRADAIGVSVTRTF